MVDPRFLSTVRSAGMVRATTLAAAYQAHLAQGESNDWNVTA
jgi:hypothetical protein